MERHTQRAVQREALRDYVAGEAREAPPVFAGRRGVVADIEATAATALARWRNGRQFPGLTRVVQGAPGAGKSALLAHMEKKWSAAREAGDSGTPVAVNISLMDLRDRDSFVDVIDEKVPASVGRRYAPVVAGALVKLVTPGTRLSEEAEREVRALAEKRDLPHPVVLMVDEAQDARPYESESALFAHLHQGHFARLPVLPVLAGLGHLRDHLGQPGIGLSRFSNDFEGIHTLGPLSDGEVRELFDGWLNRFEVSKTAGGAVRWADALVHDSQGWPMHTNHFLAALARQLLLPGSDPGLLASADFDGVRRGAAERRVAYYNTRYDRRTLGKRVGEVAGVMATLRKAGPGGAGETSNMIREVFGCRDEHETENLFGHLLARGFLQESAPQRGGLTPRIGSDPLYDCPIPSLASYAAVRKFPPHLAATLGDAALLERQIRAEPGAVDNRDAMGRTPLHVAAECRWTDVAETLLAAGANPDAPDAAGANARGTWPEFDWPKRAPERKHDNGGASGGPGGMG